MLVRFRCNVWSVTLHELDHGESKQSYDITRCHTYNRQEFEPIGA